MCRPPRSPSEFELLPSRRTLLSRRRARLALRSSSLRCAPGVSDCGERRGSLRRRRKLPPFSHWTRPSRLVVSTVSPGTESLPSSFSTARSSGGHFLLTMASRALRASLRAQSNRVVSLDGSTAMLALVPLAGAFAFRVSGRPASPFRYFGAPD